jgi:outer membrane receptor protein involved in Fe transport
MRGLGVNRSLVLLDGARMVPSSKQGTINTDGIPTALLRSTDIVTGGASAAYGADGLAGVTNFIIDRNFRGLRISTGTDINEFGDGFRYNASIAGGKQFFDNRLSLLGSVETRYQKQIDRNPEDLDPSWFQNWGYVVNPAWAADPSCTSGVWCAAGPQRLLVPNVGPTNQHPYGMISGTNTVLDRMVFNRAGTEVAPISNFFGINSSVTGSKGNLNSTQGGRLAELDLLASRGPITGNETVGRNRFLTAKWAFTENLSAYVQLVAGTSESNRQYNRADTTGIDLSSTWAPLIAIDNVYVPEFVRSTLQAANRTQFTLSRIGSFLNVPDMGINQRERGIFHSETWTVGFEWNLPKEWNLKGSYSTGETERNTAVYNKIRVDRMFLGMDAVRDPKSGNIVCRVQLFNPTVAQLAEAALKSGRMGTPSSHNPNPGPLASPIGLDNTVRDCVPYNIMGFGNISQEAINYIGTDKYGLSNVTQDFAEAVLSGEIYKGWGYGPVGAAFGLTYRKSGFVDEGFPAEVEDLGPPFNVPELGIRGIPAGYTDGSPNLHQFSTVPYVYGDFNVWEWFTEVQAPIWESASKVQRVGGSVAFRQSDYNLSGRSDAWKVGFEAVIFEGFRLRATRSHDVREASFSERFDYQGGGGSVRDSFNNDTVVQISVVTAGNPNVSPEAANTNVAGIVWQPTWAWAQGLSMSLDWYDIKIHDEITQITTQEVMEGCFEGDPEQCANITRDEFGTVTNISRRYYNRTEANTAGTDFEISYRMNPSFFPGHRESLTVRGLGGYLLKRETVSTNGNRTNTIGGTAPVDLTFSTNITYNFDQWSATLQGRFNGTGMINRLWTEGIQIADNTQSSYTFWNGSLNYRGDLASGASWTAGLSVQNLFDRKPIIKAGNSTAGSDAFGRRYGLTFNLNF